MLSCIDTFNAKFYLIGSGSFNGNYDSEELHLGWAFIKLANDKFYGKVMKDDFGFFITETELYNSALYQREFINSSGVAVSDNTIISQMNPLSLVCTKLKGGNCSYDSFNIYYFSSNKLLQKEINSIARRWEDLLQNYINNN
ncbi:MAG: hypothetical protein ACRC4Y_05170 [Cetobacterium sp.]